VYVRVAVQVFGTVPEQLGDEMLLRLPLSGAVSMEKVVASPSGSVAERVIGPEVVSPAVVAVVG